jgi:hypothetical protein
MADVSDLSHDDQVALWAGRVVRKEAEIESMLRTIYYELAGQGLSWAIVPEAFAAVSRDVRTMLKAADIPDDYRDDCLAVLDKLGEAHRKRNRIVHDQWVQQSPGSFTSAPKGVSGGTPKAEVVWDVSEFEDCFMELRFLFAQISGIHWSLNCYIGDVRDLWQDMLPGNREAIAGRIKMITDNTWEFTDPTFIAEEKERQRVRAEEFTSRFKHLLPPEEQG